MVASFTPAKTKRARVSSCIMEHNNRAAVALEFHVADVTGAFSRRGGILTSFKSDSVSEVHFKPVSTRLTNTHTPSSPIPKRIYNILIFHWSHLEHFVFACPSCASKRILWNYCLWGWIVSKLSFHFNGFSLRIFCRDLLKKCLWRLHLEIL